MIQNPIIIHYTSHWLPQTQTWLYTQIHYLTSKLDNYIVCETTENLDQFYLRNIHCLKDSSVGIQILNKCLRKLHLDYYWGFLLQTIDQKQGNILHSHFGNTGWANINIAKQASVKHVVSFYGFDVNYLPHQNERWIKRYQELFAGVDQILCLGPNMMKQVIELGCPSQKIAIHHLGINLDKIDFKPRKWQPSEPLRILIAASFREKKGIPYALEAIGLLQNEIDLEVTIIGDATQEKRSKDEKKKILEIIEKYNILPKIRMMGYQPHSVLLEEAYTHHIFLSPSITSNDGDTEGTPVTIIEMAASGMPVISTLHSDIPEIIQNGKTGLLAKERDIEGIIKHLRWLIDNHEQWELILKASRNHIENEFDASIQANKLVKIYQNILDNCYQIDSN